MENNGNPTPKTMDIKEILKRLPHRFPFLLVDRVTEVGENHIVGLKNVTINEPFFPGHFPHEPIMPGVLQCEAMAQVAGLWAMSKWDLDNSASVYFMTMDEVKFRKPVRPGDQLVIRVEIERATGSRLTFAGTCSVDGAVVSQAKMMAMVQKS